MNNKLPDKLSKLRKHYNMSQSYLAQILGVETVEYMKYENGSAMISYEQMKKLSSLYRINLSQLFINDKEVSLYDNKQYDFDKLNIAYFTKKDSFFDLLTNFIYQHKLASSIIVLLSAIIITLLIYINNMAKPVEVVKENINRLSASQTTVIYINDSGNLAGSGSNTNGELSNLNSSNPIKVEEGEGFSIILNEDGSLTCCGLIEKYAKEVNSWKNITDIAAGSSHVLAVDSSGRVYCSGNNTLGACDIAGNKNIIKVFATANGSIALDNNGQLIYSGSFIGSSSLKDFNNIVKITSSDNVLAILKNDQSLSIFTNNGENYLQAESWKDIVDVACGNQFVAGLDKYGKVHIEITNDEIKQEIVNWSDIIAIAAGNDYLIGFDGNKIYGVGNNDYGQFIKNNIPKQTLEMVTDVSYTIDERYVTVQFKGVAHASGYIVSIDVGIGLSKRVDNDQDVVKFDTGSMTDGKTYTISITSVGSGDYKDSDIYKLNFAYLKPEEKIVLDESAYLNKPIAEVKDYFVSLGADESNISTVLGSEDDICAGDIETVSKTNIDGQKLTRTELMNTKIECTYCRVMDDEKRE